MAGKPRPMSQIKQLIRLHSSGHSIKSIARTLSISKNTVKSYLGKLAASRLNSQELLALADPVLESEFFAGTAAYKDDRYIDLTNNLGYISTELKRVGVTKKLLWEEYIQVYPSGYSYSHYCFHLDQQLVARKSTAILTFEPGEKLFVDFAGKLMSYVDIATGEVIACQVFVACLPYSDYAFAIAVPSQKIPDFLYALGCCLNALGGVPQVLVPDNLKSAVIKSSRYEPDINRSLEDFANHYGMTVLPARPLKPRDKSLVENQVKMIYTRVYAKLRNQQFFDLASLNGAIAEKIKDHNQTRMQSKNYCREERFLAIEKHLLGSLPTEPFEIKYYAISKVTHSGHIALMKHYYSVPYSFTGSSVKVIYTRSIVHIYADGKQIAVHIRSYKPGGYSTTGTHLSSQNQFYLGRSPDYYLARAKEKSPGLHALVELIFEQKRYPETLYRTCDGLLRLQRGTPAETFERACKIAAENGMLSYKFIQRILENNMADYPAEAVPEIPLPIHANIRGKDYYTQLTITSETNAD